MSDKSLDPQMRVCLNRISLAVQKEKCEGPISRQEKLNYILG